MQGFGGFGVGGPFVGGMLTSVFRVSGLGMAPSLEQSCTRQDATVHL